MIKNILTRFLCFVIAWTTVFPASAQSIGTSGLNETQIRQKYPNARIVHVSAEEYPQLAAQLGQQGYNQEYSLALKQLAQRDTAADTNETRQRPPGLEQQQRNDCGGSIRESGDSSVQFNLNFGNTSSSSGSNGDDAAVVFVIIGLVMVVVWTLYFFKYLYDVSVGLSPCRWSEVSVISSFISRFDQQHARFYGVQYATGIQDGATEFGIAAEMGHSDILLIESSPLQLQGLYWFLGPVLRWRMSEGANPHYFKLHFMGGSTEHDEIGVLAKAGLSLQFAVGPAAFIGLNWGALHINLSEDQGIINERNQYHYLYGINFGMKF